MDITILEPWMKIGIDLPDCQAGRFWNAIFRYAMSGELPKDGDTYGNIGLAMAKRIVDKKRAGRVGGLAKHGKMPSTMPSKMPSTMPSKMPSTMPSKMPSTMPSKTDREREREREDTSTELKKNRIPTLDEVYTSAENLNWLQYVNGWSMEDLKSCISEIYSDIVSRGWADANGRTLKNWRAFFIKAVSEKKILTARAAVRTVPIFREEMLYG